MIKQRVFSIAIENEDLNDQIYNRQDSLFQKAIVSDIALASCATISRFERTINGKEIILDFDEQNTKYTETKRDQFIMTSTNINAICLYML